MKVKKKQLLGLRGDKRYFAEGNDLYKNSFNIITYLYDEDIASVAVINAADRFIFPPATIPPQNDFGAYWMTFLKLVARNEYIERARVVKKIDINYFQDYSDFQKNIAVYDEYEELTEKEIKLKKIISTLPREIDREIYSLLFEGKKIKEIAVDVSESENFVKGRLYWGRKKIKELWF